MTEHIQQSIVFLIRNALTNLVGEELVNQFCHVVSQGDENAIQQSLKNVFTRVMKADPSEVSQRVGELVKR